MCCCEPCAIAKSQTTALNAWRTKCGNFLTERSRRAPFGPAKEAREKRLDECKNKAFSRNGMRQLWEHPRDAVAAMTCTATQQPGAFGVHKLECASGRCLACEEKKLPAPELEQGTDPPLDRPITHHECKCNECCATHWCVGPVRKCPHCPADKPPPKLSKKRMLAQETVPMGVFVEHVHPATLVMPLPCLFGGVAWQASLHAAATALTPVTSKWFSFDAERSCCPFGGIPQLPNSKHSLWRPANVLNGECHSQVCA